MALTYHTVCSDNQGPRFSAANFAKFCSTICEILPRYYPQILYILQPVGVVVLTDHMPHRVYISYIRLSTRDTFDSDQDNSAIKTHFKKRSSLLHKQLI